jgi:hypothetical protein
MYLVNRRYCQANLLTASDDLSGGVGPVILFVIDQSLLEGKNYHPFFSLLPRQSRDFSPISPALTQ